MNQKPGTKRQDDKEKVILEPATGSIAAGIQIKFFTFTLLLFPFYLTCPGKALNFKLLPFAFLLE